MAKANKDPKTEKKLDPPTPDPTPEPDPVPEKKTPVKEAMERSPLLPNNPSFDHTDGKPNLLTGEEVMAEGTRQGLTRFVTNFGRVIFTCSIKEYENEYGALRPAEVWAKTYPNAV